MAVSLKANKAIEIDELNCSICQESYDDDDRNPRMLMCGHTFCTICLESILYEGEDEALCPECRCLIDAETVDEIPICYLVKKIMETVSLLNKQTIQEVSSSGATASSSKADTSHTTPVSSSNAFSQQRERQSVSEAHSSKADNENEPNKEIPSMGTCDEHQAPKHMFCQTCNMFICGTCAFMKHQNKDATTAQSLCTVTLLNDSLGALKRIELKKISVQKGILLSVIDKLNTFMSMIKYGLDLSLLGYTQQVNDILNKPVLLEDSVGMLDDAIEVLDSSTFQEWQKSVEYVNNLFTAQLYPLGEEGLLSGYLKNFITEDNKFKTMYVSADNQLVFTCMVNGKKKYSSMKMEHSEVLIPSLSDTLEPTEKNTLYFHLSELTDLPSIRCYFEYENLQGDYLGRVVFTLFKNCLRSKQFRMLCTGETGSSYKGTGFIRRCGSYSMYLTGGDYEYDNGQGGRQLFEFNEELCAEMDEGIVCGNYASYKFISSQFKIFYSITGTPLTNARGVVCKVVDGLDVIRKIAQTDWQSVTIKECGLLHYSESMFEFAKAICNVGP